MANCILAYEQRALLTGAAAHVAGFPPANLRDTRLDRVWASSSRTGQYLEFATGSALFGARATALAVSPDLRTAHVHPSGNWLVLAIADRLEIRSFNTATGAVGTVAADVQESLGSIDWMAARFDPSGRFILASRASGDGGTYRVFHFNPATGAIGGVLAMPGSFGVGNGVSGLRALAWASNGRAFAVAEGTAVNVHAFDPLSATISNPTSGQKILGGSVLAVDFHPTVPSSGTGYLAIGHVTSPYVNAYPITLDGAGVPTAVGSAIPPASNPGASVLDLAFSPTGDRLFCSVSSPSAHMYPWTGSGFGPAWAAPASGISVARPSVLWSPHGKQLIMAGGGAASPDVYEVSASSFGEVINSFWDTPDVYQNSIFIDPSSSWILSIGATGILQVTAFNEDPDTPQDIDVLALIGTNLTRSASWRIRGNAKRDMSAVGGFDSGPVAVPIFDASISPAQFDAVASAFGVNAYWLPAAPQTHLFWRIELIDHANPDPGFRAAYLLASRTIEHGRNFVEGAAPSIEEAETTVARTDGDADVLRVRAGRRTMRGRIDYIAQGPTFDALWPLAIKGIAQHLLFLPDGADPKLNFLLGFWGRPAQPLALPWSSPLRHSLSFDLVEAR